MKVGVPWNLVERARARAPRAQPSEPPSMCPPRARRVAEPSATRLGVASGPQWLKRAEVGRSGPPVHTQKRNASGGGPKGTEHRSGPRTRGGPPAPPPAGSPAWGSGYINGPDMCPPRHFPVSWLVSFRNSDQYGSVRTVYLHTSVTHLVPDRPDQVVRIRL